MSDFDNEIKKCDTLKQIFEVVNEHFETSEPMGIFTGNMVKKKIPNLVESLNLKRKK